ncbi:MAG: 8-oxo-dGTP diphosphatase [Actinomycetota bacterium]|nr:8-oxo-dGTP diphosphatase [Actinomycetota bacterium]
MSKKPSGKALEEYPRPSVAVDTAVLTVPEGRKPRLSVLLVRREGTHRPGQWLLPGTFIHPGETLSGAVLRSLREKAHVRGLRPRQLHVFDDPRRDDRGWVLSVAHVDVVPPVRLTKALEAGCVLASVDDVTGLAFDHDAIVRMATDDLRSGYREHPDPDRLLPESFTLLQLQRLHEAVSGDDLVKDTFRRNMQPHLVETGELAEGTVGKPARLWRHP